MEKSKLTRKFVTDLKGVSNRYSSSQVKIDEKDQFLFIGTLRTIYKFQIKENKAQFQKSIDINEKNKNSNLFLSCLTHIKLDGNYILICGLEIENEAKYQIKAFDFKGEEIKIKNNHELTFQCIQMKVISIRKETSQLICISPEKIYIVNLQMEIEQKNEKVKLKCSVKQMHVQSLVVDMDYLLKENELFLVLSFLDRCLRMYRMSFKGQDKDQLLQKFLEKIEDMGIRREERQLGSVGEVELLVGMASGQLVRCRTLETQGLTRRSLVGGDPGLQECISGMAVQDYEKDQEVLISYFGGAVALYKYDELYDYWQLAVRTKSNFNHHSLFFFYNYQNFLFALVADRFLECFELQNYFIN